MTHKPIGENSDIPDLLHSSFRQGMFQECIKCDRILQNANMYEIQKVFKHGKTIMEHAICRQCGMETVEESYSDESMKRVQSALSDISMFVANLKNCHLCNCSVETGQEHMVSALCRDTNLVITPMVMCLECMESIQNLLSDETRDNWNEFVENNIPGLPAEKDFTPNAPVPSL